MSFKSQSQSPKGEKLPEYNITQDPNTTRAQYPHNVPNTTRDNIRKAYEEAKKGK
jgi:hypothetical protein